MKNGREGDSVEKEIQKERRRSLAGQSLNIQNGRRLRGKHRFVFVE